MCLRFMPSVPADAHSLRECILCWQPGNCAHMCVVHANNATSCCEWKTPGRLPACGEGLTDHCTMEGVSCRWGREAQEQEEVEGKEEAARPGGVVSRDKARQMGQTMRHRHPPYMSTTPPSLLQSLAILLSPHVTEFNIPASVQVYVLLHFPA